MTRLRSVPAWLDDGDVTVYLGDCIAVMAQMPAASVDAIVTDPPYGLEFMGKEWDRPWAVSATNGVGYAGRSDLTLPAHRDNRNANCRACGGRARGAKRCECAVPEWDRAPGSDMLAFQSWCEAWATEALRVLKPGGHLAAFGGTRTYHRLACGVEDAGFEVRDCLSWLYGSGFPKSRDPHKDDPRAPKGLGTALKPAYEPIILARKPLVGTVAANVVAHGTGALNIDAGRIEHANDDDLATSLAKNPGRSDLVTSGVYGSGRPQQSVNTSGRWPANVVLDDEAARILDEQTGEMRDGVAVVRNGRQGQHVPVVPAPIAGDYGYGGSGGASRFFYTAKADAEERLCADGTRNTHPTVKPTDLMRWLVRLITPPGGIVLDPFAGSGSTGVAGRSESVRCILVERDADYCRIISSRLAQGSLL